ncbi:MAG: glycosyltransferase family 4 protein [Alphaproteobacteria bacterium]|nr:glycosyltransferase family 4 protein [Alphaproteobacteria bacterium]
MKILFHHRIASRDGQAVHMDELCAALRQHGHTVILVGPRRMAHLRFGGDAGASGVLKRVLPRMLYELLEFSYNLVAMPRLWLAIGRHRPDAVYERYNLFALAGPWLCRLRRVPLLLEINAPIFEERDAEEGLGLPRLARWAQRAAWRAADQALPVTQALAEYVRRAGVPEARITVIPNGTDVDKFGALPSAAEAKQRLGLAGRLVLGFIGFVRPWNSLDRVIDLLANLGPDANAHLLLVGDGPARRALEERASANGLAHRLTVTGVVPRDAVAAHLAAFDIALLPGVTPYASPLKMFEYMAAGLAIIAPDRPNIREILTHRVNAVLIDPDRPDELAAALDELCRDRAFRAQIAAQARATVDRLGLTWLNNARRVGDLIAAMEPLHRAAPRRRRPLL